MKKCRSCGVLTRFKVRFRHPKSGYHRTISLCKTCFNRERASYPEATIIICLEIRESGLFYQKQQE